MAWMIIIHDVNSIGSCARRSPKRSRGINPRGAARTIPGRSPRELLYTRRAGARAAREE